MLADLVHHVRNHLTLPVTAQCVRVFARCLHDTSLPGYVRSMCCKVTLRDFVMENTLLTTGYDEPCRVHCPACNHRRQLRAAG